MPKTPSRSWNRWLSGGLAKNDQAPPGAPSLPDPDMSAPDLDIAYVARLARLSLSPEEAQRLSPQLETILEYFSKLKCLDVNNLEPMAHAVPLTNVTRPDEIRPSLPHDDALRNAPAKGGGLFVVPKIVE